MRDNKMRGCITVAAWRWCVNSSRTADFQPGVGADIKGLAHRRIAGADQARQQHRPVGQAANPFVLAIVKVTEF